MTSPIVERLQQVATHDWRVSFLGHTADTAKEAAATIERLSAELARAREVLRPFAVKLNSGMDFVEDNEPFRCYFSVESIRAARQFIEKEPQG